MEGEGNSSDSSNNSGVKAVNLTGSWVATDSDLSARLVLVSSDNVNYTGTVYYSEKFSGLSSSADISGTFPQNIPEFNQMWFTPILSNIITTGYPETFVLSFVYSDKYGLESVTSLEGKYGSFYNRTSRFIRM